MTIQPNHRFFQTPLPPPPPSLFTFIYKALEILTLDTFLSEGFREMKNVWKNQIFLFCNKNEFIC